MEYNKNAGDKGCQEDAETKDEGGGAGGEQPPPPDSSDQFEDEGDEEDGYYWEGNGASSSEDGDGRVDCGGGEVEPTANFSGGNVWPGLILIGRLTGKLRPRQTRRT